MADTTKISFTGEVILAEERQTKTGHSFWNVVVNVGKEGGNGNRWTEPFAATFFQENPQARVGDVATVEAHVRGREYNGRHYVELRGDTYSAIGAAKPYGEPASQPAAPAGGNEDMPF